MTLLLTKAGASAVPGIVIAVLAAVLFGLRVKPRRAALLQVRHRKVLQMAELLIVGRAPGQVTVAVDNPLVLAVGTGVAIRPGAERDNASKLAGTPGIVPGSEVTQRVASRLVHSSWLLGYEWFGFIDNRRFRSSTQEGPRSGAPTLGRHSRDTKQEKTTLSMSGGYKLLEVRILSGVTSPSKGLEDKFRAGAKLIEFGQQGSKASVHAPNHREHFHSEPLPESREVATMSEMARWLEVSQPRYLRLRHVLSAVCTEPDQAREQICRNLYARGMLRRKSHRASERVVGRSPADHEALRRSLLQHGNQAILDGEEQ